MAVDNPVSAHREFARGGRLWIKAGQDIIPLDDVARLNISGIEDEHVLVYTRDGRILDAHGFDAIEAVMLLKPSAVEGRRLSWRKGAWAFHNMVGHPVMQILAWLGFARAGIRFHDWTTPSPR